MILHAALRGYVLEELLAWLLRRSGYALLVDESQDPAALCKAGNGLRVRGRGADHQVDVLGELDWPIPFSLPVRLFLEAKYRSSPVGLAEVRNALGVINDVNEHYSTAAAAACKTTYRRCHYRYALFSTSGFTPEAVQYAATQQISLIELGTPAFSWLLDAADRTAAELLRLAATNGLSAFPIRQMREALRRGLGTWSASPASQKDTDDFVIARRRASQAVSTDGEALPPEALADIASRLLELDGELYLGLTPTPFLLVLQPDDPASDDWLTGDPETDVELAYSGDADQPGEWVLVHDREHRDKILRFSLPPLLESLVLSSDPDDHQAPAMHASLHRRDRRSRSITVLGPSGDARLRFLPPPAPAIPASDAVSQLRRRASDPSLAFQDERAESRGRFGFDRWTARAARELLRRLRDEGWPQAEIIEWAAANGGSISRDEVYLLAGYEGSRTLRRFTSPVRRISRDLKREGLLHPDAPPALLTIYEGGVLARRFEVPEEFTRLLA